MTNLYIHGLDIKHIYIPLLIMVIWVVGFALFKSQSKFRSIVIYLSEPKKDSIMYEYLKMGHFDLAAIAFASFTLYMTIFSVGYYFAKNATKYNSIIIGNQIYAVVYHSKDNLLIMPINAENNTIWRSLYVYKREDLDINKTPLILSKVKNLKVELRD